jgi:hypothetical protein
MESGVLSPPAHRGWYLVQAPRWGGSPCWWCGLGSQIGPISPTSTGQLVTGHNWCHCAAGALTKPNQRPRDALWGSPQLLVGICSPPPGAHDPPARLLGAFCQTDFPGVSCIGLRVSALLLPHPSDTPTGLAPAGLLAQEALPGRLPHLLFSLQALGAPILLIPWSRIPQKKQACKINGTRA